MESLSLAGGSRVGAFLLKDFKLKWFKVVNLEKFQHYKDRNPPWIKLHNTLLDNFAFGNLPDSNKAHLILVWLLAVRHENKLPWDEKWISARIQANRPINLNLLLEQGFIECYQDASTSLAKCTSDRTGIARLEEERREEERRYVHETLSGFDLFWKSYPNKKSKGRAEKVWKKINPSNGMVEIIMTGLKRAINSKEWAKDNGQYIPHPATWLNAKGWEDEYTEEPRFI